MKAGVRNVHAWLERVLDQREITVTRSERIGKLEKRNSAEASQIEENVQGSNKQDKV